MKGLLRLYPRSWRKRYGAEMETLVDDMGGRLGVALDLVIGAAVAYRDVIAGNRILSAAGAFLHGLCVAVLVQAIGFVMLILVAQQNPDQTDVRFGPVDIATVIRTNYFGLGQGLLAPRSLALVPPYSGWLPVSLLLLVLVIALVVVLAAPRLVRRLA